MCWAAPTVASAHRVSPGRVQRGGLTELAQPARNAVTVDCMGGVAGCDAPDPDRLASDISRIAMQRVMGKCQDTRIKNRAFHAQSHLLTAGILSRLT